MKPDEAIAGDNCPTDGSVIAELMTTNISTKHVTFGIIFEIIDIRRCPSREISRIIPRVRRKWSSFYQSEDDILRCCIILYKIDNGVAIVILFFFSVRVLVWKFYRSSGSLNRIRSVSLVILGIAS